MMIEQPLSPAAITGDLIFIHEERIEIYKHVLHDSGNMDLDLQALVERIIEESIKYRDQLVKKMGLQDSSKGEIYQLWSNRKNSDADDAEDKERVTAILANDELLTINTYSMAISQVMDPDLKNLLETQLQCLKKLHSHIKQYHGAL